MRAMSALPQLTPRQLWTLLALTLVWGLNWPIMKIGLNDFPTWSFRALSMWLALPIMALLMVWRSLSFRIPRAQWAELLELAIFNMLIWHTLAMLAIAALPSGRAAILGYTMPVFSALLGAWWFGQRLAIRAWGGVAAATVGGCLLLWHEFTQFSGQPGAVLMMLLAALCWAWGTQRMRNTTITAPILTVTFWMTLMTAAWLSLLAMITESHEWRAPSPVVWGSVLYNALGVFAFAQVVWLGMARDLPPVASTLSVMFIPVIGVFSGAMWLGEVLHWQDWTAVALIALAIATVLWPARPTH
jgi:drug/metabolite transporter (DMT)-like permease